MALTDVKSEQIQSSVALAGSPTTTTQSASDNSTKIATTAYVETAVANLVASAPSALNTLDELAAALNDDASFSTTVTNSLAGKVALSGSAQTITDSGNFTIDAVGDINLDADGGDVLFKDGGTHFGSIYQNSNNMLIYSAISNADMLLQGNDGGSLITALTLDMSDAGTAIFNHDIKTGNNGNINIPTASSGNANISFDGNNFILVSNSSSANLKLQTNSQDVVTLAASGAATFAGTISSGSITATGSLNSTSTSGLGIQTSGYSFLSAANNARAASGSIRLGNGAGSTGLVIDYTDQGQTVATIRNVYVASTSSELTLQSPFITFDTGTSYTEAMRIDHDGNVNIGAKDYHTHNGTVDSLQIGYALNLYEDSYTSGTDNYVFLANNAYYTSGGNKYMRTDEASRFYQNAGNFYFQNAPSGTAGNAITFTNRFFIKADGNVGIGTTNITNPYSQTPHTDINIDGTWGGVISFKLGGTLKGWIGQRSSGNEDMVLGAASGQDLLFYTNGTNERMRINSSGYVGIGRDSDVTLEVDGPLKIRNNTSGGVSQTHTNMTVANSGKLIMNFASIGTMTSGDTIVFTYNAISWKSWFFKIRWSSTGGYMGELWAGGYNNNSDGKTIINPRYYAAGSGGGQSTNTVEGATLTVTRSGQANTMTLTLNNTHVHPLFEIEYSCGGGEGAPNASRASITVNS